MRNARNAFSRWDTAQSLLAIYIKKNVDYAQPEVPLSLPPPVIDAFQTALLDKDLALASEIVTLPTENEMSEFFTIIYPHAIRRVYYGLTLYLAKELAKQWQTLYRSNKITVYSATHDD
ncbi:MAG: aminopeptidase N C-terminal domain-containing protein, partial [Candidatus Regiella insecticola]|nr:aminopeptidase N C-terminal domain-containing protein [Candidatus Regiella insecticola]